MAEVPSRPAPQTGRPPAAEQELVERRTLRDYLIIIRERFWIALPLALIVGLGYAYQKSREVPMYQSTATMQIEKPEKVVTSQEVVDMNVNSDIELNTYLQVISSQKLRNRVADSITPTELAILQRPFRDTAAVGQSLPGAGALIGAINVQAVRNSFLVKITAYNRDPEAAALIANRYVDQFMQHLLESVGGRNEYAVDYLQKRAAELREEAVTAENKLLDYMKAQKLVSLDSSTNIVTDRLNAVNAALQQARLARLSTEDLYGQVETFRDEGKNLLEIGYISNHGTVPSVRAQLADLVRNQAVLAERYLERHPKMVDVANAINVAQAQLTKAVELAIADLKASLEKARSQEASLEREYAETERDQIRLRDLSIEYNNLANAAAVAKSNYSQILDRLTQATTSRNLEKIPVRPLDPAMVPGAPYAPDIESITTTAIGLGIAVFLAVAFGLSFIDDRIKSTWDVEQFIGANLLGIVPELGDIKDEEKYRLILNQSQEHGVESFLSVYSAVKIHSKLDFPKSVLVTSTIPGEGKTLISSNLAASFARHGRRTLIIDCDLRRPMLHRHFGQENEAGLLRWFESGAPIDDRLLDNPDLGITPIGDNIDLLRSGGRSKSPTELLENPLFGQLIERMKKHYDLVLIDSPPLGAVTDSLLIAEQTDEVIYVCRFNRAARKHIKLYVNALRSGKNELLGIVLNGLSSRRIEYYSNYRYYRSYKKYYGTQA
ncbi:MAG: polysaccharide biosynthesis tyrosine autokinase [Verrucomicrobiota bacterium]